MSDIGKRIKERREELGLTQTELADRLGYSSTSTITKIETGINDISQSKVEDFAKALNTSIAYLMGWKDDPVDNGIEIPVKGRVAAGYPIQEYETDLGTIKISEDMARCGSYFALEIHGDSMSPSILDGDIVVVRQQPDAESGETVIATIDGEDATCKRLRKYKGGIELIANNPSYPTLEFSNKDIVEKPVKILGKVVELRRTI